MEWREAREEEEAGWMRDGKVCGGGKDGVCEVMVDTPPPRPGIFPYSVPALGRPPPSSPLPPIRPVCVAGGMCSPARRLPGCAGPGGGGGGEGGGLPN